MAQHPVPLTYIERLRGELDVICAEYVTVLEGSSVIDVHPGRGGGAGYTFVGYARWGWAPGDDADELARMQLLGKVRSWETKFRLLFLDPTPVISARLDEDFGVLRGWLLRKDGDATVPSTAEHARQRITIVAADLIALMAGIPADSHRLRLVIDTNALIDDPDLTRYVAALGASYLVHVLPVVLSELDELKRAGRSPDLREAAAKAIRRLKGLRNNGDVLTGVRVAGQVLAVFDYREPTFEAMPSWLDPATPDDRLVASCLQLQSAHPGSAVYVATSDMNLQNKLVAAGLSFLEPS